MKLAALLEATYVWKGNKARFTVGKDDLIVNFHHKSFYEVAEFYRAEDENMPWAFKATGESSNSTEVFKTVCKIISERLKTKRPNALVFTADEASRQELYRKLALRMIDGLDYEAYTHKGSHVVLVKQDFELPYWFKAEPLSPKSK